MWQAGNPRLGIFGGEEANERTDRVLIEFKRMPSSRLRALHTPDNAVFSLISPANNYNAQIELKRVDPL